MYLLFMRTLLMINVLGEFGSAYVFWLGLGIVVLEQGWWGFTWRTHPWKHRRSSLLFLFAVNTDIIIVECEAAGGTLWIKLEHVRHHVGLASLCLTRAFVFVLGWILALTLALVLQDWGAAPGGLDLAWSRVVVRLWRHHESLARITLNRDRMPAQGLLECLTGQYLLMLRHLQLKFLLLTKHLVDLVLLKFKHLYQGRLRLLSHPAAMTITAIFMWIAVLRRLLKADPVALPFLFTAPTAVGCGWENVWIAVLGLFSMRVLIADLVIYVLIWLHFDYMVRMHQVCL